MWNRKVFVRIIEVLLCISCVVALRVTDDESRRVFHYLRNRSREWSLLNNVTWGTIGAALASATCGGYVIITTGLLVAAATGELRGRITELVLLGLGIILFGIVGALSLASIDSVPDDLVDNAAVLGAFCLLTALLFIIDLLMKIPGAKKKHDGTQTNSATADKEFVKIPLATLNAEKETISKTPKDKSKNSSQDKNGSVNTGFDRSESSAESDAAKENSGKIITGVERDRKLDNNEEDESTRSQRLQSRKSQDIFELERNKKYQDVGKELREYNQNFETVKDTRSSIRYRNSEDKNNARREYFEGGDRLAYDRDNNNPYFGNQDAYRRPLDEVDTPLFPTNIDNRHSEPIFAKIVNPGIKIMRVDKEFGNNLEESYRNSDSSQYDNMPNRMRNMSPGILKKNSRDVSFNIPQSQKIFGNIVNKHKDDIERLEECFNALQNSIGTQTGSQREINSPSSPNDPGYVRHTASNWPYDRRSKTPGSTPERDQN